jgi:hypothetical protein
MSQMDEFGRHEVLHMTLFLAGAVEEQLIDHEQVKSRPEWLALAKTACRPCLYQAVGAEHTTVK